MSLSSFTRLSAATANGVERTKEGEHTCSSQSGMIANHSACSQSLSAEVWSLPSLRLRISISSEKRYPGSPPFCQRLFQARGHMCTDSCKPEIL